MEFLVHNATGLPVLFVFENTDNPAVADLQKKAISLTPDGKMPHESKSSPREIQNYLGRIFGPLLDRIDLHIEVPQAKFREMPDAKPGESSTQIRERVIAARKITAHFAAKPKITCNARMGAREILSYAKLTNRRAH